MKRWKSSKQAVERVRVYLDVNPRPDVETVHFVLLTNGAGTGPVAIDNLIFCAGEAEPRDVSGIASMPVGRATRAPAREPLYRWSDNFDSYAPGSPLQEQGGWKGWGNNPAAAALVTDVEARSLPNSADVFGAADAVREFSGYDSGKWQFTAWQYIPSDFVGGSGDIDGSFFILMNTYDDAGPWEPADWSLQMNFDSNDGMLKVYYGNGLNTVDVPYIPDEWIEISITIDLGLDVCTVHYDGQYIVDYSWTGGATGVGGGAQNIAALDLYAQGSTSIYYDNLSLKSVGP